MREGDGSNPDIVDRQRSPFAPESGSYLRKSLSDHTIYCQNICNTIEKLLIKSLKFSSPSLARSHVDTCE